VAQPKKKTENHYWICIMNELELIKLLSLLGLVMPLVTVVVAVMFKIQD
jgi:hypothetical protein